MKRRLAEIWRRRNEKVGEEKEKRERATGNFAVTCILVF